MENQETPWLNARQAGRRLGVSRKTIDRLAASGALTRHRVSDRSARYHIDDIDAYARSRAEEVTT